MVKAHTVMIVAFVLIIMLPSIHASLLDSTSTGFGGQSRDSNYDLIYNSLTSNSNVITTAGNNLWVPWYKSSTSCSAADLQSGSNCNIGTVDSTHNCMVTDEFSQVGIIVSMSKDQSRMNQFYNTVVSIASTFGHLPAWRIDRNGNNIEVCRSGVDGNCDTASDGSARIIISLYTASQNPYFSDSTMKATYATLATQLSDDFLIYEVDQTCRPSSLGFGNICYWMTGGSQVKKGGISSNDYAYTGYFADGTIAMLAAYSSTGNQKYLDAAKGIEQNYLQAANFDGSTFTAPPGKSFKWVPDSNGVLRAVCTNNCAPVMWDMMDASRALGMCQANYYAHHMGITLPGLDNYCTLWGNQYMTNTNSAPIQFKPDGTAGSSQSGYFAQGLEALFQSGGHNSALFGPTLDNALKHFSMSTYTFDNSACFGVYTSAFAVRALGFGIGRDAQAFLAPGQTTPPPNNTNTNSSNNTTLSPPDNSTTTPPSNNATNTTQNNTNSSGSNTHIISQLIPSCIAGGVSCTMKSDVVSGVCRTVIYGTVSTDIKMYACEKDAGYVEIYKQQAPSITFSACLSNGCISQSSGFARFIPVLNTTPTNPPNTSQNPPANDTNSTTPQNPPSNTTTPGNPAGNSTTQNNTTESNTTTPGNTPSNDTSNTTSNTTSIGSNTPSSQNTGSGSGGGGSGGGGGIAAPSGMSGGINPVTGQDTSNNLTSEISAYSQSSNVIDYSIRVHTTTPLSLINGPAIKVKLSDNVTDNIRPLDGAYKYIALMKDNMTNVSVDYVDNTFAVKKSWLESSNISKDNVSLFYYDGQSWNPIATSISSESLDYVFYQSRSADAQEFAVSTMQATLQSNNAVSAPDKEQPVLIKTKDFSWTTEVVVVLIAAMFILLFVLNRKRSPNNIVTSNDLNSIHQQNNYNDLNSMHQQNNGN